MLNLVVKSQNVAETGKMPILARGRIIKNSVSACRGTNNPQDAMHWTTDCEVRKGLKLPDRKRLVRCHRHLQAGVSHDPGKCYSTKMSKWYNSGVHATECGICKSKKHCAELCDQNKSISKLLKVTTMTASTEMLPVLLQAIYARSQGHVKLGKFMRSLQY